jgi:3-isopropylmalate/(R)-2-methylmalate dehydratase small subunit
MQKFTTLTGVAAPMDRINIDTDQIIPKLHLRTIKRTGLGIFAFEEARYDVDGNEIPEFVLNKEPYRNAEIIVAGDNFGCGSSREHAPWALTDFGIRCVISTSFGDIFHNNSMKNGLVPIRVNREDLDALMADAKDAENPELKIDLENQEIRRPNGGVIKFDFDKFRRHCLLNGLDDIGLTLQKDDAINAFEGKRKEAMDWIERGTGI